MSFLSELLDLPRPPGRDQTREFSVLNVFRKDNEVRKVKPDKSKAEDHPYLNQIKTSETNKVKELEDKLRQSKLPPEQRKLKEDLSKSQKNYIRVDKQGKETLYQAEPHNKKSFIQVVKIKPTTPEPQPKKRPAVVYPPKKQRVEQKQVFVKNQKDIRHAKRVQKLEPSFRPPVRQKQRRQQRYRSEQQEQELDNFIQDDDGQQLEVRKSLNQFCKRALALKQKQRGNQTIRESNFDQIQYQQKRSGKIGRYQDEMERVRQESERRRRIQKKRH